MVLVGNKLDLEKDRKVTTEEGQALARELGCPFFESSAKTHHNVQEAFFELVRQSRKILGPQIGSTPSTTTTTGKGGKGKKDTPKKPGGWCVIL